MADVRDLIPANSTLRKRYHVIRRLGQGSYGQVFAGQKVSGENQHMVAIKLEKRFRKPDGCDDPRRMVIEQTVLIALRGKPHIPVIYASGKTEQKHPYIVMSLLGRDLFDLAFRQPNKHFSLHTTIRVSQQVLCGLQYLHEIGYIHRDIKPNNTCVGRKDPQNVYIIDFGMCRRFVLPNGKKRPPRKWAGIRCTYRYASIRMHERKECGPSDDIQCWLYAMVELYKYILPWKLLDDCEEIFKLKKETKITDLTDGMPPSFLKSWKYLNQLKWDDTPNYDHIHSLWRSCLTSLDDYKKKLDWEITDNVENKNANVAPIENKPKVPGK